jgi:hypothetical protein
VTDNRPRFRAEPSAWRGELDRNDPKRIRWTRLTAPPSPLLYRAAGGSHGRFVLFAGGTDNPYNYNGIGYDGAPSRPEAGVFAYDVVTDEWISLPPLAVPTMDHRSLVIAGEVVVLAGGMADGQGVTDRVTMAPTNLLLPHR